MLPKTRAEIQRAYRQRKQQQEGITKAPKKTRAEIKREYRERKKQIDRKGYEENERERKRRAYIPTSLLDEKVQARLPNLHAIVQMDFVENYTCQSNEEVQPAYWNASMVTLHPCVAYLKSTEGELSHFSRVFVSDELGHNSATVFAIIKRLMSEMKETSPGLQHVHYYTDSPTSQYRNKTMFHIVSQHEKLFGVTASWNFFEAGHGKGHCDGVGGSMKRMADEAVFIQDAADFFAWAKSGHMAKSSVSFSFVPKQDCQAANQEIQRLGEIKTCSWDTEASRSCGRSTRAGKNHRKRNLVLLRTVLQRRII